MIDKFTEALENLNYAQSTIDDYRQTLTRSGVDLRFAARRLRDGARPHRKRRAR